jgi:hypothetical protein
VGVPSGTALRRSLVESDDSVFLDCKKIIVCMYMMFKVLQLIFLAVAAYRYDGIPVLKCLDEYGAGTELLHLCIESRHYHQLYLECFHSR